MGITKQYLEVHAVVRVDNKPTIARLETEYDEDSAIVYFPIQDESFFLAVCVSKNELPEVTGIYFQSGNRVYFRATSDKLSFDELAAKTRLKPIDGWNNGEPMKSNPTNNYKFSALHFNPFPDEAYNMEYKMKLLLTELEKDRKGIKELVESANGYISIASYRYIDQFGGIHLDKELVKRLNDIGLEVDFDIYVGGNPLICD
ncbi:MAG: DUF4279 domain-containing protein [Candidatus Kapaibacterium sp.]|nr:DUF4279 domain-containing protein [Bacteroidota bacterium]